MYCQRLLSVERLSSSWQVRVIPQSRRFSSFSAIQCCDLIHYCRDRRCHKFRVCNLFSAAFTAAGVGTQSPVSVGLSFCAYVNAGPAQQDLCHQVVYICAFSSSALSSTYLRVCQHYCGVGFRGDAVNRYHAHGLRTSGSFCRLRQRLSGQLPSDQRTGFIKQADLTNHHPPSVSGDYLLGNNLAVVRG